MKRRSPSLWTFVSLLAVQSLAGCEPRPSEAHLEEGVTRSLARHRATALSELRYAYELRIPGDPEVPVEGTVEIRFRWDDPQRLPLILDFRAPAQRLGGVRLNGREAPWDTAADHVILPAERLQRGVANRVELTFSAGDEALNRNQGFLYTLFVPDRAHFSLPVFDQPDLKGRVAFTLDVPGHWKATANGPLRGVETRGAGAGEGSRAVFRFGPSQPIPPYLFAFAAGEFQEETAERAGRTLRFLHRETDAWKVERNLESIFDLHGTALEWLEEYTGVSYPFESFGFVAVPAFQYGGMEHPGGILYRASRLFLEPSPTQGDLLGRASLIAHETAHMWFGDLVTMEWFDDVWTKEVFANFFAAKIVHPSFPEMNHDLRFLLAHHPRAYGVDRTPGANPIREPLENLKEAGTLYGAIIYQKAPVVMRQLEALLGREAFQEGIRVYLDEYRYDNATWPELVAILDRGTEQDMVAWSRTWVEEPGRPTVSAFSVAGGGDDRVTELALIQEDVAGKGRVWLQPLTVHVAWGPDSTRTVPMRLSDEADPVPGAAGMPRPDFILPDVSGLGYGHMHLDASSRAWLLEHLFRIPDAMVRGSALVTLHDAFMEGEVDRHAYLDLLLQGTELEPKELIREELLGYLRVVFWRFSTPEERRSRAPEVEGALWEGVLEAQTPSAGAAFFRAYRDVALTPGATRLLRQIWSGEREVPGVTLSERDRSSLALELAVREVQGWSRILEEQEEAIENPDRKARFRFVRPAVSSDSAVREEFFASLLEPQGREREPWVLEGLSYLNHPLRARGARPLLRAALDEVREIQRTGDIFFPKRWLDAALSGHSTPEAAEVVRGFLEGLPEDYPHRLRRKVLQSADPVFRAARMLHGWEG